MVTRKCTLLSGPQSRNHPKVLSRLRLAVRRIITPAEHSTFNNLTDLSRSRPHRWASSFRNFPPGAIEVSVGGTVAYQFNGIYYRPVFANGITQYQTFRP